MRRVVCVQRVLVCQRPTKIGEGKGDRDVSKPRDPRSNSAVCRSDLRADSSGWRSGSREPAAERLSPKRCLTVSNVVSQADLNTGRFAGVISNACGQAVVNGNLSWQATVLCVLTAQSGVPPKAEPLPAQSLQFGALPAAGTLPWSRSVMGVCERCNANDHVVLEVGQFTLRAVVQVYGVQLADGSRASSPSSAAMIVLPNDPLRIGGPCGNQGQTP